MCVQDVAFQHTRASFYTKFLKNCGRGENLRTTMCLKTVDGGKKGHAPGKIHLLQQTHVLCQSNFMESMSQVQR